MRALDSVVAGLLAVFLFGVATPSARAEADESAKLREAMRYVLKKARELARKHEAERKKRDAHRPQQGPLRQKWETLANEKHNAMNDLRWGYYCSKCGRSRTEIERVTKKSFDDHLRDVKGKRVEASSELKAKTTQKYDDLIRRARGAYEDVRRKVDDADREITRCEQGLTGSRQRWEALQRDESGGWARLEAIHGAALYTLQAEVEDASAELERVKQTEEEARHAAEEFPQPGALQGLPRAEYEAAYAAQTTYREAQLRRLGKARALGAAERELYKARKEHHERSARRAKELSRIEAARKSFVAECEQKGLKGYTKGWWVVNDTQPAPAPEPPAAFQWAKELSEADREALHEQLLESTALDGGDEELRLRPEPGAEGLLDRVRRGAGDAGAYLQRQLDAYRERQRRLKEAEAEVERDYQQLKDGPGPGAGAGAAGDVQDRGGGGGAPSASPSGGGGASENQKLWQIFRNIHSDTNDAGEKALDPARKILEDDE